MSLRCYRGQSFSFVNILKLAESEKSQIILTVLWPKITDPTFKWWVWKYVRNLDHLKCIYWCTLKANMTGGKKKKPSVGDHTGSDIYSNSDYERSKYFLKLTIKPPRRMMGFMRWPGPPPPAVKRFVLNCFQTVSQFFFEICFRGSCSTHFTRMLRRQCLTKSLVLSHILITSTCKRPSAKQVTDTSLCVSWLQRASLLMRALMIQTAFQRRLPNALYNRSGADSGKSDLCWLYSYRSGEQSKELSQRILESAVSVRGRMFVTVSKWKCVRK